MKLQHDKKVDLQELEGYKICRETLAVKTIIFQEELLLILRIPKYEKYMILIEFMGVVF